MFAEMGHDAEVWGMIAFMVIAGGWIVPVTAGAIASNWRKARQSEQVALLKQSMIERGMSAEEIERVINAGVPKRAAAERVDC